MEITYAIKEQRIVDEGGDVPNKWKMDQKTARNDSKLFIRQQLGYGRFRFFKALPDTGVFRKGKQTKGDQKSKQGLEVPFFVKKWPEIMNEFFDFIKCPYPPRNELRFKSPNIRTVRYGIETAALVGSRILTNMPNELKESTTLYEFEACVRYFLSNFYFFTK